MQPISIAADHGGYDLKEALVKALSSRGYDVQDLGTHSKDPVDYPNITTPVVKSVYNGTRGILICGTGIGVSIAANRFPGIRAALCHDEVTVTMSRQHNDANIICLGGRTMSAKKALRLILLWLETPFSEEERHQRRISEMA